MMVPRAFLFTSASSPKSYRQHGEKNQATNPSMDSFTRQDVSGLRLPAESTPQAIHTSPMVIPPKRGHRITSVHKDSTDSGPKTPRSRKPVHRFSSTPSSDRPLPTSVATILEATAIPVRRNPTVRGSRKLPRGNHVHDFSKLLMDGVKSREDSILDGTGNTALDILLSPPDENDKSAIASDYDTSFSTRSMSIESMPSLDHNMESPSSLPVPSTPSSQRSPSEKRYRRLSHSEDCALNHPLLDIELPEPEWEPVGQQQILSDTVSLKAPSLSFPRLGSSFKSNLTASLRAIKSAAQTVSTFATPSVQPDDFLTRSLFTITPEMTDDRRPPPMTEPPSPALRRYLNPIALSPEEMYAYQDDPHEKPDTQTCPVSIQMQTYNRSGKRGGRKSKFHMSSSQGRGPQLLPFNPEIPPMSRQREPRENGDFLRMIVLEMNMRRSGKLRDDIPTRARIWLPPRKNNQPRYLSYESEDEEDENSIPSRWVGTSV